jgi:hypothetical protein
MVGNNGRGKKKKAGSYKQRCVKCDSEEGVSIVKFGWSITRMRFIAT